MSTTSNWRYYLRLLAMPLTFLATFLTLAIIWEVFALPSGALLSEIAEREFARFGLPVVLVAAVFEGLLLVGNYFPGAFIIVLGVVLSSSSSAAASVVLVGTLGLMLAHVLNYFLGKHGWYRLFKKFGLGGSIDDSRERLLRQGPKAIWSSYWLPSMAALVDTAAGIIRMDFKKFLLSSLSASIFWNSLVGGIAFVFSDFALSVVSPDSSSLVFLFLIFVIWSLLILALDWYRSYNRQA